jgi:hypothetical protein
VAITSRGFSGRRTPADVKLPLGRAGFSSSGPRSRPVVKGHPLVQTWETHSSSAARYFFRKRGSGRTARKEIVALQK